MATCKACDGPLSFRPDQDEEDIEQDFTGEVPDDLELKCKCHFHWQCLLDESPTIAIGLKCPSCHTYLPTNEAGPSSTNAFLPTAGTAILAQYINEGGLQGDLDIMPAITEEAYLASHPEARPARAFQTMCSEGDLSGMLELLEAVNNDIEGNAGPLYVIQYQDPLYNLRGCLHLAVEHNQVDAALVLLWLSSSATTNVFPSNARHIAEAAGIGRLFSGVQNDLRRLKDSDGLTASDLANQQRGVWEDCLAAGLL